ncbi:MAG: hypothetical protein D3917_02835 [Candidatus Electrothrix sp. AX5]|nr:hypothetical protein [Candidatus Electrothrix sp. AX5]
MLKKILKKALIFALLVTLISGCASTSSRHKGRPDGEVKSNAKTSNIPGSEYILIGLGFAVFVAAVCTYAPEEAWD